MTNVDPYKGNTWYTEFTPNASKDQLIQRELALLDGNLTVPPELLESSHVPNPLLEMLPALDAEFNLNYWPAQAERIEQWGGVVIENKRKMNPDDKLKVDQVRRGLPVLDKVDKQEGFSAELAYAKHIAERVLTIHEHDPLSTIVLLHDLDESAGFLPEPPEGEEYMGQTGDDDVDNFVIRPALAVVTEYLYTQKGIKIRSGAISTKDQKWLDKFYNRLDALCPDIPHAFDRDLMLSSRDGRFIQDMGKEVKMMKSGASMDEVYSSDIFPGYGALRQAMNLSPQQLEKSVAAYDLKPLMGIRVQNEPDYATSTVVLVDDWGLMSLYTNTHSDQQAVALESLNAKFATPDVLWERAYLEIDRAARIEKSPLRRADLWRKLRNRFVPPDSVWAETLIAKEAAARAEADQYLELLKPGRGKTTR